MRTILERVENLSVTKQELLRLKLSDSIKDNSGANPKSNQRLTACIVLKKREGEKDNSSDSYEIRKYLSTYLPNYMIPSNFIFLDSLPLTPGGKIDINTIRSLDVRDKESRINEELVLPSTENEKNIAEIWEELLNLDKVGIHDNFFELGGDSISGIQFISMANKQGINITLKELFQYQTIYEIAKMQENSEIKEINKNTTQAAKSVIPIKRKGSKPPLFGIHTLGEGLAHYKLLSKYLKDQPVYGLHYGITLTPDERKKSMPQKTEDLAKHYIEEMQLVQPEGPYFLVGACLGGNIAFEMAQQLISRNQKVGCLFLLDTFGPGGRIALPLHKQLTSIISAIPTMSLSETVERIKDDIVGLIKNRGLPKMPDEAPYRIYRDDVVLFRAENRREALRYKIDPKLGWDTVIRGNLDIYDFPGGHLDIIEGPFNKMLADTIELHMEKALRKQD